MTTIATTALIPQLPRLPLTKAMFPVAGLGTRFLPATKAVPKEMLPTVDKPLIQYAVEEAFAAGIRQMIFVTGRNKRAIEDHFDTVYELETKLEAANKHTLIALVRSIKPHDMSCVYVRQSKALGLGRAVLRAEPLVGNEAFAVLLADDLMIGQTPILQQIVQQHHQSPHTILAVQDVPLKDTERYGIADVGALQSDLAKVLGMVEKPISETAPSTLAVADGDILTPGIFDSIRK